MAIYDSGGWPSDVASFSPEQNCGVEKFDSEILTSLPLSCYFFPSFIS